MMRVLTAKRTEGGHDVKPGWLLRSLSVVTASSRWFRRSFSRSIRSSTSLIDSFENPGRGAASAVISVSGAVNRIRRPVLTLQKRFDERNGRRNGSRYL